jgi:hypothetical protein
MPLRLDGLREQFKKQSGYDIVSEHDLLRRRS